MIGVILTGYGGPESLDLVEPFLNSIAGGRKFTPEQVEGAKQRYALIGGRSPLNDITGKQAGSLEKELNREDLNYSVSFGMLHLPPFIRDSIKEIIDKDIKKARSRQISTTGYQNM